MIIIPALDIIDKEVVRLSQGDYARKVVYHNHPVELARRFCSLAKIHRLHLVDLSGAKSGTPEHAELFGKIRRETNCILEAGGGIRTVADAEKYFDPYGNALDANKDFLMIGTLPVKNPEEFGRILERFPGRILLTLDVWEEELRISGWQESAGMMLFPFLEKMIALGVRDYLITQIRKDGMLLGPDFPLYRKVLEAFPEIRLTASGGVSSLEDLRELEKIPGLYGAILGRAFYEDRITLKDLGEYLDSSLL